MNAGMRIDGRQESCGLGAITESDDCFSLKQIVGSREELFLTFLSYKGKIICYAGNNSLCIDGRGPTVS